MPCTSNVVTDYNADPTGATDSTAAFWNALNATPIPMTSAQPGNVVCVPPGTYMIGNTPPPGPGGTAPPDDVTILPPAAANGGALIGPGHGVATIVQYNNSANILDSCPVTSSSTITMPIPTACAAFSSNNTVTNWRIEHVTLAYNYGPPTPNPGSTKGPLNAWVASAIYFPSVNGLEVHNVTFSNVWNCYDFGSQTSPSALGITLVENTGFSSCFGHLLALHGAASNVSVVRQAVLGGRGAPPNSSPYLSVMYDTSDVGSNTLADFNFLENDWEQGAWGMLAFLADGTAVQNEFSGGNVCYNFTFACYLFFARPNQTGSSRGLGSRITIEDKRASSWYSPVQLDGGGYSFSSGSGVGSIQFNGGALEGGVGANAAIPPTYASSVFFIEGSPAPGGYSADGSSVTLQFPYGGVPYTYSYYAQNTGETPRTIAEHIAAAIGCAQDPSVCDTSSSIPSGAPIIGTTYVSNPYYAPIEMYLNSPLPQGFYTAQPYKVITSGNLRVVNQQLATTLCTFPPSFSKNTFATTPAPCYTGWFDQGDALVVRNSAHDVQITGSKLRSRAQAAVHIMSSGDYLRAVGNVLGYFNGAATYDCVRVEAAANPNVHIAENDCTGAANSPQPLYYPSPYPSPSVGYLPVLRNNRGLPFKPFGLVTTTPPPGCPMSRTLGPLIASTISTGTAPSSRR